MSEGKQFNYQCRCCFLEVILCNLPYVAMGESFPCSYDNGLVSLLCETDIQ